MKKCVNSYQTLLSSLGQRLGMRLYVHVNITALEPQDVTVSNNSRTAYVCIERFIEIQVFYMSTFHLVIKDFLSSGMIKEARPAK